MCMVCGRGSVLFTCMGCGALVCGMHYDPESRFCVSCRRGRTMGRI